MTDLVLDARLNKEAYGLNNKDISSTTLNVDGWEAISLAEFSQTSANFAGQLFKGPDGTYKIAYRGTTDLLGAGDTVMNVDTIGLNIWTPELTDAIKFTLTAIKYIQDKGGVTFDAARQLLSVTGHSQGGFESEVAAKFFGLSGTSLDGPGAAAITQTQSYANLKTELRTNEPGLLNDYPIENFVARRYTFLVGAINAHLSGVDVNNSLTSLAGAVGAGIVNPLLSIGLQALYIHNINNIIDIETARANSRLLHFLSLGETDTLIAQVGGDMYPTHLASVGGSGTYITPDPAILDQINNFLTNEAGLGATIYVKEGVTYIEGAGGALLMRKDGSGERWITADNTVTQDILGAGGIVSRRVTTQTIDKQTITDNYRYDITAASLELANRIVQTVNSDASVTRQAYNGAGDLQVTSTVEQLPDGTVSITSVYTEGGVVTRIEEGAFGVSQSASGAQTLSQAITTYGPSLIDALSLIKAIQTGAPLPILASGLRLATDLDAIDGTVNYLNLRGAANVGSGALSLLGLEQALKQGDTLGALTAGAQALSFGAQAYTDLVLKGTASGVTQQLGTFLNGTQAVYDSAGNLIQAGDVGALPYLNLVNSIAHGDAIGAALGALQIIDKTLYAIPGLQPLAIAYTVFNLITSLFGDDDPPEPWGSASAVWSGDTAITQSTGGDGGQETVHSTFQNLVSYLNNLAAYEQSVNPGSTLGVVANRLPSISYRNYTGFQLTDIDPLTGVQRYPEIKYDLDGHPYNAPPGSEQASQSLNERFLRVALARGAIAPLWEVQTAAIQTQYGDPQAGLTEEERAGRNGQLAAPPTGPSQTFRPVALDLNGDGIHTTGQNKTVAFDIDDSGYLKNTAWLNTNDAFLFLDRNLNGSIDTGKELFNNSLINVSQRGLQGMRWIDSNYDGKLTSSDPVWNELKVWRDGDIESRVYVA